MEKILYILIPAKVQNYILPLVKIFFSYHLACRQDLVNEGRCKMLVVIIKQFNVVMDKYDKAIMKYPVSPPAMHSHILGPGIIIQNINLFLMNK